MRAERRLLRIGECLVRRACRRLPRGVRQDRYEEWTAELPAILHDPQTRAAPLRAARMLAYAADTLRGTATASAAAGRRTSRMTVRLRLLLAVGLVSLAWTSWNAARSPGSALSYVSLSWALLLVAYPVSMIARSARRVTLLICIGATLAGAVANLWIAAQAAGDWFNYLMAALLFLAMIPLLLASRLAGRRA